MPLSKSYLDNEVKPECWDHTSWAEHILKSDATTEAGLWAILLTGKGDSYKVSSESRKETTSTEAKFCDTFPVALGFKNICSYGSLCRAFGDREVIVLQDNTAKKTKNQKPNKQKNPHTQKTPYFYVAVSQNT